MIEFMVNFKITETSKADLINSLDWLRTNYGSKIEKATASYTTLAIEGYTREATFSDAAISVASFDTQFGSKLELLDLSFYTT